MAEVAGRRAPTIRLRRLASELRRLRVEAKLTVEKVTKETGLDQSSLYRIERALNKPQRRTVITLLQLYQVEKDRQTTLLGWLKESGQTGWFQVHEPFLPEQYQAYVAFEHEAEALKNYESLFIPGLLQTAEYARAVIVDADLGRSLDADAADSRVDVRMQRQSVFTRPVPMQLHAVVDEAALRREVGSAQIMRAQLERLAHACALPNVRLQVVPFKAGAHPGMPGSFVIMDFADPFDAPLVYVDGIAGDAFLETGEDVARFARTFDLIAQAALSPAQSKKMIQEAAKAA
ncbi:Scr1 family TA system antitoxin-like transcriptional regulator [Actinoplanes sp. NPDC051859]|uniref:Scr1 family TA system antitoxin-like transcriptional regulator n=1 Tax=Actinoplanes sp. NPDC051859 TaxID=3363909 RepID=UPI0037B582B1